MKNIPEMIQKFVEYDEERKRLDKLAKEMQKKVDDIKSELADVFAEQGVQSMSAHGRTVYLVNVFSAKPKEGMNVKMIAEGVVGSEYEELLTINSRTLTSFIREEIDNYMLDHDLTMADELNYDDMLPEAFKGKLDIGVYTNIASRKG